MENLEFVKIMAYLSAACGKPIGADVASVYFDLLGDLSPDVLMTAARRVVLQHPWSTVPSIAELRQAAAETMRGEQNELSPAEAWEMAWRAASGIDLEIAGAGYVVCGVRYESQAAYVLGGLPPLVQEAIRAFGLPALVYGEEPVGVVRGQFVKIFEQLAARDRRVGLFPAGLKADIQRLAAPAVRQISTIDAIGRMPDAEAMVRD